MGAYGYMLMNFDLVKWRYVGTPAYAAPASGSHTRDRKTSQPSHCRRIYSVGRMAIRPNDNSS